MVPRITPKSIRAIPSARTLCTQRCYSRLNPTSRPTRNLLQKLTLFIDIVEKTYLEMKKGRARTSSLSLFSGKRCQT